MDLTPFAEGDVVLVNRWKTPQRGDVVLYEINNYTPVYRRGENRRTVYTGENIDRILAGPGDEVQFKSGILLVNGAPSPWQPLNNRPLPDKYSWMVPPGCYVIFPSGAPGVNLQDTDFLQNMGNVPLGNIVGRAYMQTYPLSRIHLIR
jgi:signal peptidase I